MVRNKILTNNMMAVQKFVTPFLNLFLDRLHDHALSHWIPLVIISVAEVQD